MEKFKEILGDFLAIGLACWWLFVMLVIQFNGYMMAVEYYPIIRYTEIAVAVGVIYLQIDRLVGDVK